ncbi:MAG: urea carboxylase-associated family protein [Deltaproteobacteria bacterium]|nr:urea carboxylase-associated family protein [Deltaproteobacteria bacterium]MBI2211021.1 urea carboxylase-associated family protein [Deltaproteobacteria bacterium]MBI2991791.1 urea carboxylase-associated family protein [Deltaproteobacteria bacterium]
MKKIREETVPYNTGWAADLQKGQVLRITATTTVDFVCFRRENLKERFDQARTKVYNMKIFITTGDKLMGRNNQHMMTIIENTNREGTHDLQKGMCSGYRFQLAKQEGKLRAYYHRDYKEDEIPDHGCYENLSRALAAYGIAPEDIPNPFNLNQHMKIDGATGRMEHTTVRAKPGDYVELRAEMNLLVALSACPDMPVGGKPVDIMIYEP